MEYSTKINWRYVAEFVALASVVLSLLFVGYEIRQNSLATRMSAYENYQISVRELGLVIATDPIITPLLVRANNGELLDDFTDVETVRMLNYLIVGVRTYEDLYRSVQSGVIPPETLRNIGVGTLGMATPIFKEFWDSFIKQRMNHEFGIWFESQIPSLKPNS